MGFFQGHLLAPISGKDFYADMSAVDSRKMSSAGKT